MAALPVGGELVVKDPIWLLALLALPAVMWRRQRRKVPVLLVPFAAAWHAPNQFIAVSRLPIIFATIGLVLLTFALARPQRLNEKREVRDEGYDIMLSIDLSTSMRAEDFERDGERINRLQAIKPIIDAFISRRPHDRIGMVVFSGRAYTLAPLTFQHDWIRKQIERLRLGMIEDGTAIGDGLGVAITRLEQTRRMEGGQRKGAFVVLMTDGANNRGLLQPEAAAALAKARGIPVFTVGAGKDGYVPVPVLDDRGRKMGYRRMMSDLDEPLMREIARITGGRYFRASDMDTAEAAFKEIDKVNKIEFQAKSYVISTELFVWLAAPGLVCVLLAAALARSPSWRSLRAA